MTHVAYCMQFVPAKGAVLDIGSGRGAFVCGMAERGALAHGIELNPAYIRETAERARDAGVTVDMREGRAESLPFPDLSFDFVNCSEVTEHVDDPSGLCKEMYRVMKHGAYGYISFHNRFGVYDYHYHLPCINWMPRAWAQAILRLCGRDKPDGAGIGRQKLASMHYYTYARAHQLLTGIGFRVEDIRRMKIRKQFRAFSFPFLFVYMFFCRPLYFNTFHLLLQKPTGD